MRTCVVSAGGKSIHEVARDLFSTLYKNLTAEKKKIVHQGQLQMHAWSIDHTRKCIHAIGMNACTGRTRFAKDGSLIPCPQCVALLSLHTFRNAISREPPKNENCVYVPHTYQPAAVGKLYSLSLNELLDGVRITCVDIPITMLILPFKSSGHSETLLHFVQQVLAGNLDDRPVFMDLVQVLVTEAE
jgi:hypothetical protein